MVVDFIMISGYCHSCFSSLTLCLDFVISPCLGAYAMWKCANNIKYLLCYFGNDSVCAAFLTQASSCLLPWNCCCFPICNFIWWWNWWDVDKECSYSWGHFSFFQKILIFFTKFWIGMCINIFIPSNVDALSG